MLLHEAHEVLGGSAHMKANQVEQLLVEALCRQNSVRTHQWLRLHASPGHCPCCTLCCTPAHRTPSRALQLSSGAMDETSCSARRPPAGTPWHLIMGGADLSYYAGSSAYGLQGSCCRAGSWLAGCTRKSITIYIRGRRGNGCLCQCFHARPIHMHDCAQDLLCKPFF